MENIKQTIADEQFKKEADAAEIENRKLKSKEALDKLVTVIQTANDSFLGQGFLKIRLVLEIYT
jgi:hypothetical protein